ncbi:hypothetical protein ACFP56_12680 [Paenibacillus septentrionalis]|uniref:DUF4162 domain-containing protein n=1 Tax=Paenibacillus septentrionalis TaxID=429342 RepID=A0ABW1V3Y7_9BACL
MLQVEQLGKSYASKVIVQDLQLLAEGTLGELQELVGKSTTIHIQLEDIVEQQQLTVSKIELVQPNLETVFLHLTGRSLRD